MAVRVKRVLLKRETGSSDTWEMCFADCCVAYDCHCVARGGEDVCEGTFGYDPAVMNEGEEGMFVRCICPCHKFRNVQPLISPPDR